MNANISGFELPLFTNLLILLVAARLLGEIFERFRQPAMLGEILAGIILGPSLLGIIHRTGDINVIAELGVFMLVISAGIEINIDDIMRSFRRRNILIPLCAFFMPFLCGFTVSYLLDMGFFSSVFIGLCISITALPVSMRILMDLGKINSEVGQKIISSAILQDVLALTVLGIILNMQEAQTNLTSLLSIAGISVVKLAVFIGILFLSYFILKKLSKKEDYIENSLKKLISVMKGKESLFVLFFAFILIFAAFTETLGFHFIIGAFFASLFINEKLVGHKPMKAIRYTTNSLSMGFLSPIFFASIGLEFNILAIQNYALLAAVILVAFTAKVSSGFLGGKLAGMSTASSITLGIGLNTQGVMELVIANIAYQANLISIEIFSIFVLMCAISILITPTLLKWSFKRH